jgi:hypothetical protein
MESVAFDSFLIVNVFLRRFLYCSYVKTNVTKSRDKSQTTSPCKNKLLLSFLKIADALSMKVIHFEMLPSEIHELMHQGKSHLPEDIDTFLSAFLYCTHFLSCSLSTTK